MERIIATVRRSGTSEEQDLELPTSMTIARLAPLVVQGLGWQAQGADSYQVEAYPPGRPLHPQESLADAGLWDGALLDIYPIFPQAAGAEGVQGTRAPVKAWRPLTVAPEQNVAVPPTWRKVE